MLLIDAKSHAILLLLCAGAVGCDSYNESPSADLPVPVLPPVWTPPAAPVASAPLDMGSELAAEGASACGGPRFVFTLDASAHRLHVIDTQGGDSISTSLPDNALQLACLHGAEAALVTGTSGEAVVVRIIDGSLERTVLEVVSSHNHVAVSHDGLRALAYTDYRRSAIDGGFEALTLFEIDGEAARSLEIGAGFHPVDVVFAADDTGAAIIAEREIDVARFTGDESEGRERAFRVELPAGRTLDIAVTSDLLFAVGREQDSSRVVFVNLDTREISRLDLAEPLDGGLPDRVAHALSHDDEVTGLALDPLGRSAIAVLGRASAAVRIDVPDGFVGESEVSRVELPGFDFTRAAFSPDGAHVVLYGSSGQDQWAYVLTPNLSSAPLSVHLPAPVQKLEFTSDGRTALAVHVQAPMALGESVAPVGFTVFDLRTGDSRYRAAAPISLHLLHPDGGWVSFVERDDTNALNRLVGIDLADLSERERVLAGAARGLSAFSGDSAFIVEEQAEGGRLTLVNWADDLARSLTGYEIENRLRP